MTGDGARIAALEAEVARLERMLEGAPNFITCASTDGTLAYVNRVAPGLGTPDDVVGQKVYAFLPPAVHDRVREAIRAAVETRETQELITYGTKSADEMGYYLTRISPLFEGAQVTSVLVVATDITEQEERRIRLELATEATGLGIWSFEAHGRRGDMDARTREIFGIGPEHAIEGVEDMLARGVHAEDRERVAAWIEQAVHTGIYRPIQHRIVRPSGDVRWVQASGVAIRGGSGEIIRIVGGVMDITERRAMESRLAEAQKLESIGRLAGGIAHDFNNMLTTILGNVDFALEGELPADEVAALLGEVKVAAQRSAALTAQLLAFARRQVVHPSLIDPNRLIARLGALLARLLGEHVQLDVSLRATAKIEVDPSQFEQIVLNLVTNARDAMAAGGRVQLETEDVVIAPELAAQLEPELEPGPYVRILVRDSGPGIDERVLGRVFEPFFSTRAGGTGLGLATCYGIVKQNRGHIEAESRAGEGATFRVYLPCVEGEEEAVEQAADESRLRGAESILVVEDEPAVRRLLVRTLEGAGYRVQPADDPHQALRLVEAGGDFDLLVTDVVMPGMSGIELGRRVRACGAIARVLHVSGYASEGVGSALAPDESPALLAKPFVPRDLLLAVRRLLDEA